MMAGNDPLDHLSSAYRVEIEDDTRDRHLAEIGAAIRTAPPTPVPTGFALRRRLAGALAGVAVVVAPIGMAVAAEESVPGDFLYPMKQVTERVRAFVDDDIEATHRVEEVERLMFTRAPRAAITRAVERAESATGELIDPTPLDSRLERARERLRQQELDEAPPSVSGDPEGSGQQPEGSPSGPPDEPGQPGKPGEGGEATPAPDAGRPNTGSGNGSSGEAQMTTTTHLPGVSPGDGGADHSSEVDPAPDDAPPGSGNPDASDASDAGESRGELGTGGRDGSGSVNS